MACKISCKPFFISVIWTLGYLSSILQHQVKDHQLIVKLKSTLSSLRGELIPWDIHEMKILARSISQRKTKTNTATGYITTIFDEKVFCFAKLETSDSLTLMVASTAHDYLYESEHGSTKVFLSDKYLGTISEENSFLPSEGDIPFVYKETGDSQITVSYGSQEIVDLILGAKDSSTSERLMKLIHSPQYLKDERFIALVFFLLLMRNRINK